MKFKKTDTILRELKHHFPFTLTASLSAGVLVAILYLVNREYFVGEGSGKRIGDRVHLADEKAKYDIDYYLGNQILPAVENIFDVFGIDVRAVIDGEKQKKLF